MRLFINIYSRKKTVSITIKCVSPSASIAFVCKDQFSLLSTFVRVETNENYSFETNVVLTGGETNFLLIFFSVGLLTIPYFTSTYL